MSLTKIREILEKYLGKECEFGIVPRDSMFDDLSFDNLEKELIEVIQPEYPLPLNPYHKNLNIKQTNE